MDEDGYIDVKDLPRQAKATERRRKILVVRRNVVEGAKKAASTTSYVAQRTWSGLGVMYNTAEKAFDNTAKTGKKVTNSRLGKYLGRVAANQNSSLTRRKRGNGGFGGGFY